MSNSRDRLRLRGEGPRGIPSPHIPDRGGHARRPGEPGFTHACSLVVTCETQADIDRYWDALTRGGEESQCGWLKDRYGVSWQIVPRAIGALLGGPDPAAAGRAMQAMLGMRKLDIAALERARQGDASLQVSRG